MNFEKKSTPLSITISFYKLTLRKSSARSISGSKIIIWLLGISFAITLYNMKLWEGQKELIVHDVVSYYAYLPAYFVHDDLSLSFVLEDNSYHLRSEFWPQTAPNGAQVIKTTMGMSFLYAPFFLAAHSYAKHSEFATDGFSIPYQIGIVFSAFFFFVLGLIYLRKLLLLFFEDHITSISIIIIVLGTNLIYYETVMPALSHGFSFTLICAFLYYTFLWHRQPNYKRSIFIGLLLGLIVLIRPTNGAIALVPFLFGITQFKDLTKRFNLYTRHWKMLLLIIGLMVMVILPQLLYWKTLTDQWLFFSYQGERFFFDKPRILEGLFSYRKGWFLYTPLILLSFAGIGISYKTKREFFWPSTLFFSFMIYLTFSWWCWWYGGGFSARPMIDFYGLSALLTAIFLQWVWEKKLWLKISIFVVIFLFIGLSIFQNLQAKYTTIHYDSNSKETYWSQFLILSRKPDHAKTLSHPDYDKAMKGEDEYNFDPF